MYLPFSRKKTTLYSTAQNHTLHRYLCNQIWKYQILKKIFQFFFNSLSDYFFQSYFPKKPFIAQKRFTVFKETLSFPLFNGFFKIHLSCMSFSDYLVPDPIFLAQRKHLKFFKTTTS